MTDMEKGFLCGRIYEIFKKNIDEFIHREYMDIISAKLNVPYFISMESRLQIDKILKRILFHSIDIDFTSLENGTKILIKANREDIIKYKIGGSL